MYSNLNSTILIYNKKRERFDVVENVFQRLKHSGQKTLKFFHRGTPSDIGVVRQIFRDRDYDLRELKRHADIISRYNAILAIGKTPLIIDCGANIGASVVYWSTTFPDAKIVAVEPDPGNFSVLKENVGSLNACLINAAVSSTAGTAFLTDPNEGEWGYRLGSDNNGREVNTLTLSQVIQEQGSNVVPFLIKIDIEGGEKDLFSGEVNWFDDFYIAIVELHDWMMPCESTAQPFLKVVADLDRDFVYRGENVFSIKHR